MNTTSAIEAREIGNRTVVAGIAAIVLIVAGLERMGLWPDALTAARMRP